MSKNIAFLTVDWSRGVTPVEPNGCAYYRCWLPSLELEKYGWGVGTAMPEFHPEHGFGAFLDQENVHYGWDIIVFKLIMMRSVVDIMNGPMRPKQKIVVDIDDFFEGLPSTNLAHQNTDPDKYPDNNREHYFKIIESADALITSTQFLYDFYTKEKGYKNVFLVRNGIDIERWHKRKDHSRYLPTLGWVGATPWRSEDLEKMTPFFGEFMKKNSLPFHHSGHIAGMGFDASDLLGLDPQTKFTHETRKVISKYPQLFKKIDIGIVPLSDIPFNYAKSTIKGLEYTAAGVPFISSWSPEYEFLEKDGVGRVARNHEEWEMHLTELLDPKIRKEEIDKNYEIVKQRHTMSVRGEDWNNVMESILDL